MTSGWLNFYHNKFAIYLLFNVSRNFKHLGYDKRETADDKQTVFQNYWVKNNRKHLQVVDE